MANTFQRAQDPLYFVPDVHTLPMEVFRLECFTPCLRKISLKLADALGEGSILSQECLHSLFHLSKSGLKVIQIVFPRSSFRIPKPEYAASWNQNGLNRDGHRSH